MTGTGSPLTFTKVGSVAHLKLNRPKQANALNLELVKALMGAAIECDEDAAISCVTLTGEGRFFCVGGDVTAFAEADDQLPYLLKELTTYFHAALKRLVHMKKPLITAVNGPAAGAGFSLAMLGDIVLAADTSQFSLSYGGVGLSPDGGASWLLPKLVGLRKAQEMLVTSGPMKVAEAHSVGLVTRVVGDKFLSEELNVTAEELANSATHAIGQTRNLLLAGFHTSFAEHLELETRVMADCARTLEAKEGVAAFLEKRKPVFSGLRTKG